MNYTHLAFSLLFHALFLFVALCLLYLFFISGKQEVAMQNQVDENIKKIVNDLPSDENTQIAVSALDPLLKNVSTDYSKNTRATDMNNARIQNMMILATVSMILLIILPYLFLRYSCKIHVSMTHVIMENLVFFACIGAFELYFFKNVIFKYVPIMPSTFKDAAVKSVIKHFSS